MNKEQLIDKLAGDAKITKVAARAVLASFIEAVKKTVKKGDRLGLVGFGTFSLTKRKARSGRNPQTGKDIVIPASKSPKFKAGKALKDIVNA